MKKNNKRPTSYKAKPKRKTRRGSTPKKKRDEMVLITIKDYDKYQPFLDELKRRGITAENYREHMAEVEELSPLFEHCRKGGGQ